MAQGGGDRSRAAADPGSRWRRVCRCGAGSAGRHGIRRPCGPPDGDPRHAAVRPGTAGEGAKARPGRVRSAAARGVSGKGCRVVALAASRVRRRDRCQLGDHLRQPRLVAGLPASGPIAPPRQVSPAGGGGSRCEGSCSSGSRSTGPSRACCPASKVSCVCSIGRTRAGWRLPLVAFPQVACSRPDGTHLVSAGSNRWRGR